MESRYQAALAAYRTGDAERTRELADAVISDAPDSPEGLSLRLLRARAFEFGGYPDGIQLQKAYEDYRDLELRTDVAGSEVLLGAARVLFDIDAARNELEIERLCKAAIRQDGSAHGYMMLGFLNEKVRKNHCAARRNYMAAFARGLSWGARYAAKSHGLQEHKLKSVALHVVATLASPLLALVKGVRGPFS